MSDSQIPAQTTTKKEHVGLDVNCETTPIILRNLGYSEYDVERILFIARRIPAFNYPTGDGKSEFFDFRRTV